MDKMKEEFITALQDAIRKAGSQTKLAIQAGMHQSRISDYLSERYLFDNITIGSLRKLFPGIHISYNTEWDQSSEIEDELEQHIINIFRSLSPAEKIQLAIKLSELKKDHQNR